MIRAILLVLVFLLGAALAALWLGQMHHLRQVLPDRLPPWTQRIAPEARLRHGRIEWEARGLVPELTLQWTAQWPGPSGWRWEVMLTGAGIDVTGTVRAPFWPGTAEVTVTGGTLDLARLVPLPGAVSGRLTLDAGEVQLRGLGGTPTTAGRLTGRVAGAAAAGADLGGGPAEARISPDGTWSAEATLEGGVTGAAIALRGQLPDPAAQFEVIVDDDSGLPPDLRGLLSGAGRPEGNGWVVEGSLRAF